MKRTYIDIRDKSQNNKLTKTYIYKNDVSVIVTSINRIMIIEHEQDHKTSFIDLTENETFSVRNWGN